MCESTRQLAGFSLRELWIPIGAETGKKRWLIVTESEIHYDAKKLPGTVLSRESLFYNPVSCSF